MTTECMSLIIDGLTLIALVATLYATIKIARASINQTEYLTRPVLQVIFRYLEPLSGESDERPEGYGHFHIEVINHSNTDAVGLLFLQCEQGNQLILPLEAIYLGKEMVSFPARLTRSFTINVKSMPWSPDKHWGEVFPNAIIRISIHYKAWLDNIRMRRKSQRYSTLPRLFQLGPMKNCREVSLNSQQLAPTDPDWSLLESD